MSFPQIDYCTDSYTFHNNNKKQFNNEMPDRVHKNQCTNIHCILYRSKQLDEISPDFGIPSFL